MRRAGDLDVVWRVIVVGVGVVQKPPVFDEQAARIDRGRGLRMPTDRRLAMHAPDRLDALRDQRTLLRLVHPGVRLPAPAVALDLIAALRGGLADPRRRRERAGAGIERQRHAIVIGERANAPVADARAIFEMALEAQIGRALDLLDRLMDGFVALVTSGEEQLRTLLDVEHHRHRDARATRPAYVWVAIGVPLQIPRHEPTLPPAQRPPLEHPQVWIS